MFGSAFAALLLSLSSAHGGEAERATAGPVPEACTDQGSGPSAVTTLRRLVRQRCDAEAVEFAAAVVPSLPWAERLATLGVAAEVPAGEQRLGPERLALAEAILDRIGHPPAEADTPRRAALSTEAILTVVCLQRNRPPRGTTAKLLRRFIAAQAPDEALVADLLAMRRVYLRWRYRTDCAAELAEALAAFEAVREL